MILRGGVKKEVLCEISIIFFSSFFIPTAFKNTKLELGIYFLYIKPE